MKTGKTIRLKSLVGDGYLVYDPAVGRLQFRRIVLPALPRYESNAVGCV